MKKFAPLLLALIACGEPAPAPVPDGKLDPARLEDRKLGFTLGVIAMSSYANERNLICATHLLETVTYAMTSGGSHVAAKKVLSSIETATVLCAPLSLSDMNAVLAQLKIEPLERPAEVPSSLEEEAASE